MPVVGTFSELEALDIAWTAVDSQGVPTIFALPSVSCCGSTWEMVVPFEQASLQGYFLSSLLEAGICLETPHSSLTVTLMQTLQTKYGLV